MSCQESKCSEKAFDLDAPIIFLLGVSGSGRSSFINELIPEGQESAPVGHGIRTQTTAVRDYRVTVGDKTAILVDTPGTDFSEDILDDIQEWMGFNAVSLSRIHGLVFLHPIGRNRSDLNMTKRILDKLIGSGSGFIYRRVVLATSRWPSEGSESMNAVHVQREASLQKLWSPLIKQGATVRRYNAITRDAAGIIRFLLTAEAPDLGIRPRFRDLPDAPTSSSQPTTGTVQRSQSPKFFDSFRSLFRSYAGKVVIALLGPTGSGKSSFIARAIGKKVKIGTSSVEPCTTKLGVYQGRLSSGREVVLVDTPGYDIDNQSPESVLRQLIRWRAAQNTRWCCLPKGEDVTFSSILLFHSITDNRVSGDTERLIKTLEQQCKKNGTQSRVQLVTSRWNEVKKAEDEAREELWKEDYWKRFLVGNSQVRRFDGRKESAEEILDPLVESGAGVNVPIPVSLIKEMPRQENPSQSPMY